MEVHELAMLMLPLDDSIDGAALQEALERVITNQQTTVDADLAVGRNLLVNETDGNRRLVHRPTCPSVVGRMDRHSSWIPNGWTLDDVRTAISRGGHDPKMPYLVSEDELDQLPSYSACKNCQPGLRRSEKKMDPMRRASNPDNLGEQHIGRTFVAGEDQRPFGLVRIVRTITAEGTKTTLYDHSGRVHMADGDPVLMLPRTPQPG